MGEPEELAALRGELERTRARLRRAEAMLALVERTGRIGLWEADLATGDGTWSPVMYDFYSRDPALGPPGVTNYADFVHPEDHPGMEASMAEMMGQPVGATPPILFRTHPDLGPVRHLETSATLVSDARGAWATGAVVDVTERETARLTTRRLEQILDRMPFVVFGLDREGRVTFSNQQVSPEDVEGVDYRTLAAEDSRQVLDEAIARAWATGEVQQVRAADVRGRWWESRYVGVLDPGGEVEELLGITVDITEQRELEQAVHQAQHLESLGVLAGGIAHDFNNLLVGIMGNADLALEELSDVSPAGPSLAEILASSRRAADLCRQILAYSGRGRFVIRLVDPGEVVREIAHLLRASIAKTAALCMEFDPDTRPVEADVTQLRQVVMNLITNASDALEGEDGIITLATGTLHCDREYLARAYLHTDLEPGQYTFLEVSDTGVGMDEATQARMFEPFFSSRAVGRGLGLAAVLGIVRGHGGSIRVYSELGRGTTIKVLLPAAEGEAEHWREPTAESEPWEARGAVLVVDDEAAVRKLASRALERVGFRVLTAENGVEALEVYAAHAGEVVGVLLDMTMPVMGGEETFRRLRALDPDVRVVLSSGYNEQEATRHFAGKGLAGFLQKPYRVSDLRQALRDLFDD